MFGFNKKTNMEKRLDIIIKKFEDMHNENTPVQNDVLEILWYVKTGAEPAFLRKQKEKSVKQ